MKYILTILIVVVNLSANAQLSLQDLSVSEVLEAFDDLDRPIQINFPEFFIRYDSTVSPSERKQDFQILTDEQIFRIYRKYTKEQALRALVTILRYEDEVASWNANLMLFAYYRESVHSLSPYYPSKVHLWFEKDRSRCIDFWQSKLY